MQQSSQELQQYNTKSTTIIFYRKYQNNLLEKIQQTFNKDTISILKKYHVISSIWMCCTIHSNITKKFTSTTTIFCIVASNNRSQKKLALQIYNGIRFIN